MPFQKKETKMMNGEGEKLVPREQNGTGSDYLEEKSEKRREGTKTEFNIEVSPPQSR